MLIWITERHKVLWIHKSFQVSSVFWFETDEALHNYGLLEKSTVQAKHTHIRYVLTLYPYGENEPVIYACTDAIWSTVIIFIYLFFIRESTCGSWIYIHLFSVCLLILKAVH